MYAALILLHIAGVVVFIGTIVAGLFWQRAAVQIKNPGVTAHTYRMLNRLDRVMTPVAVIIIIVTGVLLIREVNVPLLRTGWLFWSLVAWGISGIVFATVLFPLQKRIEREAGDVASRGGSTHSFAGLEKRWARWAHVTFAGIVIAFVLMSLKPALPMP